MKTKKRHVGDNVTFSEYRKMTAINMLKKGVQTPTGKILFCNS